MHLDFAFLVQYWPDLWVGLRATLLMTLIATSGGALLGLLLALGRLAETLPVRMFATAYVEFVRATPLAVQLIWFFFVIPALTGLDWSGFAAGTTALMLNASAYFAEIFRAGLEGIDAAQRRSCRVLGLSGLDELRFVILPQAILNVLPPLVSLAVLVLRSTALTSIIGAPELMNIGNAISAESLHQLETLTAIALIYFVLAYPLTLVGERLEARLGTGRA